MLSESELVVVEVIHVESSWNGVRGKTCHAKTRGDPHISISALTFLRVDHFPVLSSFNSCFYRAVTISQLYLTLSARKENAYLSVLCSTYDT